MAFEIIHHSHEQIVEVIYPADPSAADVEDYLARVMKLVESLKGPWASLVDQTRLRLMPPAVFDKVAPLNAWAATRGMRRSARIVAGAVGGVQTMRMTHEAKIKVPLRTFASRPEALVWLKIEAARSSV